MRSSELDRVSSISDYIATNFWCFEFRFSLTETDKTSFQRPTHTFTLWTSFDMKIIDRRAFGLGNETAHQGDKEL